MLKHKRLISVIAVMAFFLTMLAPAVVVPTASAATSYNVPLGEMSIAKGGQDVFLSYLRITESDKSAGSMWGDTITVKLPSGAKYAYMEDVKDGIAAYGADWSDALTTEFIQTPELSGTDDNPYQLGDGDVTVNWDLCTANQIVFTVGSPLTTADDLAGAGGVIDIIYGYYPDYASLGGDEMYFPWDK
ncbi:MAG: hypothetical protein ACM3MK_04995, partial [Chitinophagales bacterium]